MTLTPCPWQGIYWDRQQQVIRRSASHHGVAGCLGTDRGRALPVAVSQGCRRGHSTNHRAIIARPASPTCTARRSITSCYGLLRNAGFTVKGYLETGFAGMDLDPAIPTFGTLSMRDRADILPFAKDRGTAAVLRIY